MFSTSDSSVFFAFKHDLFSMYPLVVLSHFKRRFLTYNTYCGLELASPPHWRIGHIWDFEVRSKELRNVASIESCAGWQNVFPWFTASGSSVFFLFIQTRFVCNVPFGSTAVVSSGSIIQPIMHIIHPRYYGHARSEGVR